MKYFLTSLLALMIIATDVTAQEKKDEHLLDGTSMDCYYQNGSAVHVEFMDGKFKYKWIAGPAAGAEGSENYRSRKISTRMYMVNVMVAANKTFVTIVYNFNQNMLSTSALIAPGTANEATLFDAGIIEHLTLKEN